MAVVAPATIGCSRPHAYLMAPKSQLSTSPPDSAPGVTAGSMQLAQTMKATTGAIKDFKHEAVSMMKHFASMKFGVNSTHGEANGQNSHAELCHDVIADADRGFDKQSNPKSASAGDDLWLRNELMLAGALRVQPSAETDLKEYADFKRQLANSKLAKIDVVDEATLQALTEMGFSSTAILDAAWSIACDSCVVQQARFDDVLDVLITMEARRLRQDTDSSSSVSEDRTQCDHGAGIRSWMTF